MMETVGGLRNIVFFYLKTDEDDRQRIFWHERNQCFVFLSLPRIVTQSGHPLTYFKMGALKGVWCTYGFADQQALIRRRETCSPPYPSPSYISRYCVVDASDATLQ
jgi:hypothetical protein